MAGCRRPSPCPPPPSWSRTRPRAGAAGTGPGCGRPWPLGWPRDGNGVAGDHLRAAVRRRRAPGRAGPAGPLAVMGLEPYPTPETASGRSPPGRPRRSGRWPRCRSGPGAFPARPGDLPAGPAGRPGRDRRRPGRLPRPPGHHRRARAPAGKDPRGLRGDRAAGGQRPGLVGRLQAGPGRAPRPATPTESPHLGDARGRASGHGCPGVSEKRGGSNGQPVRPDPRAQASAASRIPRPGSAGQALEPSKPSSRTPVAAILALAGLREDDPPGAVGRARPAGVRVADDRPGRQRPGRPASEPGRRLRADRAGPPATGGGRRRPGGRGRRRGPPRSSARPFPRPRSCRPWSCSTTSTCWTSGTAWTP